MYQRLGRTACLCVTDRTVTASELLTRISVRTRRHGPEDSKPVRHRCKHLRFHTVSYRHLFLAGWHRLLATLHNLWVSRGEPSKRRSRHGSSKWSRLLQGLWGRIPTSPCRLCSSGLWSEMRWRRGQIRGLTPRGKEYPKHDTLQEIRRRRKI